MDVLPAELRRSIDGFIDSLNSSSPTETEGPSSVNVANTTVQILKRIVEQAAWNGNAQCLMQLLKCEGKRMTEASGTWNLIIGNLVRRVLNLIREDYRSSCLESQDGVLSSQETPDFSRILPDLKDKISQSVDELSMELVTSADEISDQALEHIHATEVILTFGRSRTVEMFLKRAACKGRTFQVIVAEAAPFYSGHKLAKSLAQANIQTTVVTDSAIFAVMSRVNKVIVGTHSIMADGGLKALNGVYTVALAASHYSVPFIVAASMHKLTPQYYTRANKEEFGCFVSPQEVLKGGSGGGEGLANAKIASKLHAQCPLFEYVPPDLVTLFISNMSGYAPSYVYRLLQELYHPDDYEL